MKEIVRISLDNEMDLILAHKRTMKLVELCGMSQIVQTSFATAVSEVARSVIGKKGALLRLAVEEMRGNRRQLAAIVHSDESFDPVHMSALRYAKKLTGSVNLVRDKDYTEIKLEQGINFSGLLNETRIKGFVDYFQRELPLSPYDELRKKNIQLLELAEKLRSKDSQYERLTETLPLMIFSTNGTGELIFTNKWYNDFFSLPDTLPAKLHWTKYISRDDSTFVREEWQKSMENKRKFSMQLRFNPSGSPSSDPVWHLLTITPVTGDEDTIVGWTGFAVDVNAQKVIEETLMSNSQLKEAQKQLLSYQERLEEKISELNKSNHDLEQFAYIASHDLQEPLRKIRTFTEMLEDNIDNPAAREKYLSKIDTASERMTRLIKDVLNYSRLTKSETVFEKVQLNELIDEVQLDMELLIEERSAKISVSDLPVISGIRQQLYQLFYNLIGNALKFNATEPVITISCKMFSTTEPVEGLPKDKQYVEIKVSDNGIGFDNKYVNQVFTIFKRLNLRDKYSGTGIGLALCKKIVDNHYGLISADSEPEKGAIFTIVLPIN